jgi:hypothetical protein
MVHAILGVRAPALALGAGIPTVAWTINADDSGHPLMKG